jgi:hypothetical protein
LAAHKFCPTDGWLPEARELYSIFREQDVCGFARRWPKPGAGAAPLFWALRSKQRRKAQQEPAPKRAAKTKTAPCLKPALSARHCEA